MYIKNEVELFSRVGVLTEYNTLVGSLVRLGLSIVDLAKAETYGDDLFEDSSFDEFSQEYVYGCLGELKAAFKKNTGGDLDLYYIDELSVVDNKEVYTAKYWWTVNNFYIIIKAINPEITTICKNDLSNEV